MQDILLLDKELFLFLNKLGGDSWDGFWLVITNKWASIPLYLLLLWISYKFAGPRRTLYLLIAVALLITVTDQLANFFKYGVQRPRPCHEAELMAEMRLVKAYCGGKFGYFSAHAANAFALANFFRILFRQHIRLLDFALPLWALLVAYSRIYIGVHYPHDVITGILIGLFLGWLFAKLYIFAMDKFRA